MTDLLASSFDAAFTFAGRLVQSYSPEHGAVAGWAIDGLANQAEDFFWPATTYRVT
jgi:hypothetical protein